MFDTQLSIGHVLGILALVLAWLYGLWKALRYTRRFIHRRTEGQTGRPEHIEPPEQTHWSAVQILFYLSNTLIFAGLAVRLILPVNFYPLAAWLGVVGYLPLMVLVWYCEFHTEVEPKLIDLSIDHELKTRPRYEEVLLQSRAIWPFEHPVLAITGILFTLTGASLAWLLQNNDFLFLAGFGLHLLLFAYTFGRWTILTVRTNNITLKRWLSVPDTIYMPRLEIQNIHIHQTFLHSLWNASDLILTGEHLLGIEVVIKNAREVKARIENPPVEDLSESQPTG